MAGPSTNSFHQLTVADVVIAGWPGTAIETENGPFYVHDSTITENAGWGIICDQNYPSDIQVRNSTISNNAGGGIYSAGQLPQFGVGRLTVEGSTISGNRAGGIRALLVDVSDSEITNNTTDCNLYESCGGAGVWAFEATLLRSIISRNTAERTSGGGIMIDGGGSPEVPESNSTIADCEIYGNASGYLDGDYYGGGGISIRNSASLLITDSSIFNNNAPGRGGGLSFGPYGPSTA